MRRLLFGTLAFVSALTSWAATRAEYAYGLQASQDGDVATFTFRVTGPVMDSRIILTSTIDNSTIEIPVGAIDAAGEQTINYDMSGLSGDYTWAVDVTTEAIPSSTRTPLDVTRTSSYRGGVVCITDPQSDAFGYTVIGMATGIGFTTYTPGSTEAEGTYLSPSDAYHPTNIRSLYRGCELDGKAVFSDLSDIYSAYHVFDPLNPTAVTGNLLAADGFHRNVSSGIWVSNTDATVTTGGNSTCAAFYKDAKGTHLITLGEDINPANTLVRYTLDANGKISSTYDKRYTNATARATSKDCEVIAIENGFFVSYLSSTTNTAAEPAFFYCDYEDNVKANSSDITRIKGSYSGIAINASRDMLAFVGRGVGLNTSNRLYIFKITWNNNVPSFELVNDIAAPTNPNNTSTLAWASLRFDYADNLWVYYDHLGTCFYGIQNLNPQSHTTPAKTGNTVAGTMLIQSGIRALAYDLSCHIDNENRLYEFTYSLSADAGSVVFKLTDPDTGVIKHEVKVDGTTKGTHTVKLDLNQLEKNKNYEWTVEVEAFATGEYAKISTLKETTVTAVTHGSIIPVTEPNSEWFGYTLTGSGNGFTFYDPALELSSEATTTSFNSVENGTFYNGYAYVANKDASTAGIYKVNISNLGNPEQLSSGTPNTCVAFHGTQLYTFDYTDTYINRYDIGTAAQIETAPTVIKLTGVSWFSGDVDIITTDNGYFASQTCSVVVHYKSCPGFVFCDYDNTVLYNSGDHTDIIPSCSSGIAINAQGDRFAVCRYNDGFIDIYEVTWDTATPTLSKLAEITAPASSWSQLRFDPAGNLHAYHSSKSQACYNVYSIKYPAAVTTTCCPTQIAGGVSGVDIIEIEPAVEETPRYYNLQGVEVNADNLTPGIYIKVCNGHSTKVQVR